MVLKLVDVDYTGEELPGEPSIERRIAQCWRPISEEARSVSRLFAFGAFRVSWGFISVSMGIALGTLAACVAEGRDGKFVDMEKEATWYAVYVLCVCWLRAILESAQVFDSMMLASSRFFRVPLNWISLLQLLSAYAGLVLNSRVVYGISSFQLLVMCLQYKRERVRCLSFLLRFPCDQILRFFNGLEWRAEKLCAERHLECALHLKDKLDTEFIKHSLRLGAMEQLKKDVSVRKVSTQEQLDARFAAIQELREDASIHIDVFSLESSFCEQFKLFQFGQDIANEDGTLLLEELMWKVVAAEWLCSIMVDLEHTPVEQPEFARAVKIHGATHMYCHWLGLSPSSLDTLFEYAEQDSIGTYSASHLLAALALVAEQSACPFLLTVAQPAGDTTSIVASSMGGRVQTVLLTDSWISVAQLQDRFRQAFEIEASRPVQLLTTDGTLLEASDTWPETVLEKDGKWQQTRQQTTPSGAVIGCGDTEIDLLV